MNKRPNIAIYLAAGLAVLLSGACNEDHTWDGAGPKVTADNPGVHFTSKNERTLEMDDTQTTTALELGRDITKSSEALDVPLKIRYAASTIAIPAKASFAAGAKTTKVEIAVTDFELYAPYSFAIEIDPKYGNPYDATRGSTRFDGRIEVVKLLGTATFTPGGYSGSRKPEFVPFEQRIYDKLDGSYLIKNFLNNNAGYSFTFSLDTSAGADPTMNILPADGCGYHDLGEKRWYFYSANSSSSDNRIPCYIPGNNPEDWITYLYFYAWDSTDSRRGFWLDTKTKTGQMSSYCRFTESSSGVVKFDIKW